MGRGSRVVQGFLLSAVVLSAVVLSAFAAGCHSSSSGPHGAGGADGGAGTSGGGGATGGGGTTGVGGVGGVGGSSGGSAGALGGDITTPEGFCQAYYAAVIDSYVTCLGVPPARVQPFYDDSITCMRFTASIAAHRSSFAPAKARACLDELAAALACNNTSTTLNIADCGTVLVPLVPVGGTCKANASAFLPIECMGGSYCKANASNSCDGTCTVPAALNQPCDLTNDVRCAGTLTCDSTSKTCVMATDVPMGGTCDDKNYCAKGLYCDKGADGGAQGTCQPRKTSGPCTSSTDCAQPLTCAGPTGARTCVAAKHPGDSCTPKQSECDLFSFCGADGKCSDTFAAIGQPCGSQPGSDNLACAPGEYCDAILQSGTCRAKKQPGDACTGTALFECDGNGGHCDTTTKKCVACPF
jgi:hypothetical protein